MANTYTQSGSIVSRLYPPVGWSEEGMPPWYIRLRVNSLRRFPDGQELWDSRGISSLGGEVFGAALSSNWVYREEKDG
jgi:hypothetical protein